MTDRPQPPPLVPAEVDLQDFAFMPLDVRRLRDSDLATDESPEACWAAVLLWSASWHQVPAASIPNNDQWIAKQAGYAARGKIDPAWKTVRPGALRGWILCTDDRYYHPVVSEKALEAWRSKREHAYRKMCDRLRKENKARAEAGSIAVRIPSFDEWNSAVVPSDAIPDSNGTSEASDGTAGASDGIPLEKALKGQGRDREGTGIGFKTGAATTPVVDPPASLEALPGVMPAPLSKSVVDRALDLVVLLRGKGVQIVPGNPHALQWAKDGITDAQLLTAADRAEETRQARSQAQPLNAGYLNAVLSDVVKAKPTYDLEELSKL